MIEYLLLSSLFFQELHLDSEPLEKFLSALQVGGEIAVHVCVYELYIYDCIYMSCMYMT